MRRRAGQLRVGERGGVGDERVRAQGDLPGLVVEGHQRPRALGAELLPPQARDPLRVGVLDGGVLGRVVVEGAEQRRALARGAAEHGVDQSMA